MNRNRWTILVLVVLLMAVNLFLIFKKESKVERAAYIDKWTEVKEQDLVLSKNKPGVVVPAEEEYVYYQSGSGVFEEFLVTEGEEVRDGTSLFEYSPVDIEATISNFEAEISKLESEKEALEENIEDLERLELVAPSDGVNAESMVSTISAEISEKNRQLGQLEAEIDKYDELIDIAEDGLRSLTVDSRMGGVVKEIRYDLQNPVITITSHDIKVAGVLNEEESLEIAEGMKVVVTSNKLGDVLEGTVSGVSVNPIAHPELGKESQYSFTVQLDEQPETVLPSGSQVELKITVAEAEDALTVPEQAVKVDRINVLGSNGKLEKRKIETGLAVNETVELVGDAAEGEFVVYEPGRLKGGTAFFTPVSLSKLSKTELKNMPKKEILRYIGRGFLTK